MVVPTATVFPYCPRSRILTKFVGPVLGAGLKQVETPVLQAADASMSVLSFRLLILAANAVLQELCLLTSWKGLFSPGERKGRLSESPTLGSVSYCCRKGLNSYTLPMCLP
jgi:hypothetical protein